jgi:hypothetical protein
MHESFTAMPVGPVVLSLLIFVIWSGKPVGCMPLVSLLLYLR